MKIVSFLLLLVVIVVVSTERCINKHCSSQEKNCKEDKAELPCFTAINTCLDLCPSATNYACLSLCLSSRKNEPANKFLNCCAQFSCKVEKFTALKGTENMLREEA